MGWGSGKGKAEVLVPAAEVAIANNDDPHAFADKIVLIDVSGIAHMASKKQPHLVVREGMSTQQQEYVTRRLEAVVGEGGKPVLVLDGRAYPPKAATRASRRADRGLLREPRAGFSVDMRLGRLIWASSLP